MKHCAVTIDLERYMRRQDFFSGDEFERLFFAARERLMAEGAKHYPWSEDNFLEAFNDIQVVELIEALKAKKFEKAGRMLYAQIVGYWEESATIDADEMAQDEAFDD
jgi:hypothetical protein